MFGNCTYTKWVFRLKDVFYRSTGQSEVHYSSSNYKSEGRVSHLHTITPLEKRGSRCSKRVNLPAVFQSWAVLYERSGLCLYQQTQAGWSLRSLPWVGGYKSRFLNWIACIPGNRRSAPWSTVEVSSEAGEYGKKAELGVGCMDSWGNAAMLE